MAKPENVLSQADYKHYRNVRAILVLFILLGSLSFLAGIGEAFDQNPGPQKKVHPAAAICIAVVGLSGVGGGVVAFRGNRRWAPLVYLMAGFYGFGFPIGTTLSIIIWNGLPKYLDCVDRIKDAERKDD